MQQFALDFIHEAEYNTDDFLITNANLEAYRAVHNPQIWPDNRLLIVAEPGSGKTHLANIFAQLNNAIFLNEDSDFQSATSDFFILENIEQLKNEEFLFHLINYVRHNNKRLLMTAGKFPKFSLADLRSRINATLMMLIKSPDESLFSVVLAKQLHDRQISVSPENMQYIITHAERSFAFITEFCDSLNKLSLQFKSKPTINLIKQLL